MTTSNPNIYVRQWDMGSFTDPTKKPYKISERYNGTWECSCPAWTRHTPRTDCKHIAKIKRVLQTMATNPVLAPQPTQTPITQATITFDGYTIRRRALDDTLTDDTNANTTTIRRSRREI